MLINVVAPPQPRGKHPVMNAAFKQALSAIQKGAEERLEVLKTMKNLLEGGKSSKGTALKLIGHIEKLEPEDDGGDEPVGNTGE